MIILDPQMERGRAWCRGVTSSSHMSSDTSLKELLEFAQKIGLKQRWLQRDSLVIHFDLTPGRHKMALQQGAIEVTADEWLPRCKVLLTERGKEFFKRRQARQRDLGGAR